MRRKTLIDETAPNVAGKTSRLWGWLGGLLSAGLIGAIAAQLGGASGEVLKAIRQLPLGAWPAFLLLYLTQTLFDYAIFRRLWRMPMAGFEALLRKNVINEVVLGYSGEAFLYVWARRASRTVASPFAAIKDANIVSALMGNVLTLVLALVSATQLQDLDFARRLGPALWSGLIPVAISLGVLAFGRRVFSLRLGQLFYVAGVCGLRLGAWAGLTVLVWSLALPLVAPAQWVVLLAIRLLVSRIPLISNKDLVFGGLMLLLLGAHSAVAVLLAALAVMTLGLHLAVIVGLGLADLARGLRRAAITPSEMGRVVVESSVHD
ncbi:hypothetical protein [Caulobacter sp. FWC26]|uniref:hypothetical protein n=1 Tax=Caulobacter sp. FWC26 TaxID=69665 RepID=UPI00143DBE84|nr:hypothetical protein [Caulobacter sp. FWC26]